MYIIKRSKKPFKSGKYVEKVISEGDNPITGKPAFIIADNIFVEKRMVREATSEEYYRYKSKIVHEKFYPEILRRYVSILGCDKYYQKPDDPCSNEHLLWMIIELDRSDIPDETKHRWLGYIQGVMISRNLTTLETERNLTRPYFK